MGLFVCVLGKLLHEPCFLLGDGEVGVVEQKGVVGLAQGGYGAVWIDVVAFLDVGKYVVVADDLAFGGEFVVAALCAYFGRGGDKYFESGYVVYPLKETEDGLEMIYQDTAEFE